MTITADENISGLDDLFYDVTLTDASTGAAITTGTVSVKLCTLGTVTALGSQSTKALAHVAAGRWTGVHDAALFEPDLPDIGRRFDRVLLVSGITDGRLLARCRRVAIIDERE
jgi:hypothetical protein